MEVERFHVFVGGPIVNISKDRERTLRLADAEGVEVARSGSSESELGL